MFDIISIGSYQLLIQVLNGLAMLTSAAGPAGYGGMVALGLAVGVLLTVARAIVTQKLELQWVLVGWMLYSVMFVPKVTVTVTDVYTGATNAVANVPIGPAAIGGLTSQVGQTLTEAMGTVFTMPSMSSSGYMDTLTIINGIRDMDLGDANDGTLNNNGLFGGNATTVNFTRSIDAYMRNCVMLMLYGNLPGLTTSYAQLQEAQDLWNAINVPVTSHYTPLWISEGVPNGAMYTCDAAYTALGNAMTARMMPAYVAYIGKKLKLTTPMADVQNSLDTLFGVGKNAQIFMMNALLKKQFELAEIGALQDAGDTAGVAVRVQAMEQRRVQWATEQSLFQEMARPLIAYVEAFFYAVAPIVAFLLTLGSFGINLFSKYLLLAVWIQLWMPMMAVNNLYVQMAASESFTQLQTGGHDLLSMMGLNSVWTETASWLATGGMMAGATPLLALMLLTGSYFAMTSLTNRMAGADHVNEKSVAPDVLSTGAMASVGAYGSAAPRISNEALTGSVTSGLPSSGIAAPINWGKSFQAQESSADSARAGAAERVSAGFGSSVTDAWNSNQKTVLQTMMRSGDSTQVSQTDQQLEKIARGMFKNESQWSELSDSTRAALKANVAMALSADGTFTKGVPMGGSGNRGSLGISPEARAGLDNVLEKAATESHGSKEDLQRQFSQAVDTARQRSVQIAGAISVDESTATGRDYLRGLGVQDSERWGHDVEEFASKEKSYQTARVASEQVGAQASVDPFKAAGFILSGNSSEDRQVMEGFAKLMSGRSIGGQWDEWTGRNIAPHMNMRDPESRDMAHMIGGMDLIAKRGDASDMVALHSFLSDHGVVGSAYAGIGNSAANENLIHQGPVGGSVRDDVDHHAQRPSQTPSEVRSAVSGHMQSDSEVKTRASGLINDYATAMRDNNHEKAQEALSNLEHLGQTEAGQRVQADFKEERGLMEAMQQSSLTRATSDLSDGIVRPWVDGGRSVMRGDEKHAFGEAYAKARENGENVFSATAAGLRAAGETLHVAGTAHKNEQYEKGVSEATEIGLPAEVANYHGELQRLNASPVDVLVEEAKGMFGNHSDELMAMRSSAVTALGHGNEVAGEKGITLIERAASATDPDKDRMLKDAAKIYRGEAASNALKMHDDDAAHRDPEPSQSALEFSGSRVQ